MLIDNMIFSKRTRILIILPVLIMLSNCNAFKPEKVSEGTSTNALERARKNVEEGRGVSIGGLLKNRGGGTGYQFSSSNPMWRASLETLDFLPLSTVDYSGGVIISDWYNDSSNNNDAIKITIRFLSNEILSNSLKIIVHKKTCNANNACKTNIIDSKIKEELVRTILTRAATFEKENKNKK